MSFGHALMVVRLNFRASPIVCSANSRATSASSIAAFGCQCAGERRLGLYTVQQLLGHANAKATQRYAHLSRETLAQAVEAMSILVTPNMEVTPKSSFQLSARNDDA